MSSEPAVESRGGQRRFWLTIAVTIAALTLATVGLTVANAVQGPRLVSAEINAQAAVERAGQRLILRLDQAVADVPASDIAVSPAVPVSVSLERATLMLRFGEVLDYATSYQITVPVRSTTTDAASALTYTLRTPDAEVFVLQRTGSGADPGQDDQIVRTVVGSSERDVVHHEPAIQEFAVAEPNLAVITGSEGAGGRLTIEALDGSEPSRTLTENSDVTQLQSSGRGGRFGFVVRPLSGPDQDTAQLTLYDPAADEELIKVVGLDGRPLEPQVWTFVPGTNSIVAQTADASFYLVDPTSRVPVKPLGSHVMMLGFVDGTATLIVQDPNSYTAIDLVTGSSTPLPEFDLGDTALYQLLDLPGDRGMVAQLASFSEDEKLRYSTATIIGNRVRPLYAPEPATTWIQQICLSPNGQYLAVETIPADAVPDGHAALGYTNTTTVFVEVATGRSDQTVPGFGINWCN